MGLLGVSTVPAPTTISGRFENSRIRSSAPGTVSVNSHTRNPPRIAASIAGAAASCRLVRRIALARASEKKRRKSSDVMGSLIRIG